MNQQLSLFRQDSGATFSPDRKYRYKLWRIWNKEKPMAMFIGLNPSTADEHEDDPTIRRCKGFALNNWDYGGIIMVNLFGYRATNPKELREVTDPVGPDNDSWLLSCVPSCQRIVAAWGAYGGYLDRDLEVMELLISVMEKKLSGGGAHGGNLDRDLEVMELLVSAIERKNSGWRPLCFGTTQKGYPKHPLYLPKLAGLVPYKGRS